MKIRTDFVTNSSSSSFAEVHIDNPVLLELIKEYGVTFENKKWETLWALGYTQKLPRRKKKEWAAWIKVDGRIREIPTALSEVLLMLLEAIEENIADAYDGTYDENVIQNFGSFRDAALQRQKEIDANYLEVKWTVEHTSGQGELDIDALEELREKIPDYEFDMCDDLLSVSEKFTYTPEEGEKTERDVGIL